jgi:glutathione S-transferase
MKLFFSPLACSLATRIALYEAGVEAEFVEVDPKTKKTSDGTDYRTIHPLGLVPALEIDDGVLLTENAAILQWVAARFPEAELAPRDPLGRARLQQWLCYIGTELHKALFVPLLDATAPKDAKEYALAKADSRLRWLASQLEGREFLLDRFSIADAYLYTVLNWAMVTPVTLEAHPAITAFQRRMRERPSVARAFGEERTLYAKEIARHAAASVWRATSSILGSPKP